MEGFGRIIATVNVNDPSKAGAEAEAALAAGADRAEIRIDAFPRPSDASRLTLLAERIPLLFSGNRISLDAREAELLKEASARGAWIDIPFGKGGPLPAWVPPERTVLSSHRKVGSYDEAEMALLGMRGRTALVKLVPPADGVLESARFLSWIPALKEACGPLIAFPSGDQSGAARILALSFGSEAAYAASRGSDAAAPGQPTLEELLSYRPSAISRSTSLYGLLGYPLGFSLSPAIWNSWFDKLRLDARLLLFPSSGIGNALDAFRLTGVKNFGVTSPHKEAIIENLDRLSRISERCGAVNTVFSSLNGLTGTNTDVFGIRRSLSFLRERCKVLILGSGGAARAAAFALRKSHSVAVAARDGKKGRAVAEDAKVRFVDWEKKHEGCFDLIINATTCGSDGLSLPWPSGKELGSRFILEMVTRRGETPLERKAAAEGVKVIPGRTMLFHQARLQFRILTGIRPPGGCLFHEAFTDNP